MGQKFKYQMEFIASIWDCTGGEKNELSRFCADNNEPLLIGGDFNIIRYAKEKNTKTGVHRYTPLFNALIQFYELREIVLTGGLYTWSNNQANPTMEKLDRILVRKDWEDIFPQAYVTRLTREVSDHNPLILSSGCNRNLPYIQFRFDMSWIKNPDFYPLVEKIWNKPCKARSAMDRIQQKLKSVKQYFKGWGFNLQGEMRKKKKGVSKRII